jgi:hypothetical protein
LSVSMIPANRFDADGSKGEKFSGSVLLRGETARESEATTKRETGRQRKTYIRNTRKEGPVGCPVTSVRNYHYTLRNMAEQRISLILRGGSLKSSKRKLRVKTLHDAPP